MAARAFTNHHKRHKVPECGKLLNAQEAMCELACYSLNTNALHLKTIAINLPNACTRPQLPQKLVEMF